MVERKNALLTHVRLMSQIKAFEHRWLYILQFYSAVTLIR